MIKADIIAREFNFRIEGDKNKIIIAPGNLRSNDESHIFWLKSIEYAGNFQNGTLVITEEHFEQIQKLENVCYLITEFSARLMFSKVVNMYFNDLGLRLTLNQVEYHRLNKKIVIADNVYISEDVTIGNGTIIYPNVVIHNDTIIGSNCIVKSNCTIGTEGLGYTKEENQWIQFPQIGGVRIAENVIMGPSVTIRRGALDNTIIEKGVKIGSFTNIGHNCVIGENSILTCQCVTGGSTILGKNVYMGISAVTKNAINVGDDAVIGAGAVVVKNIAKAITVVGNPAENIKEFEKWSKKKKNLLARH